MCCCVIILFALLTLASLTTFSQKPILKILKEKLLTDKTYQTSSYPGDPTSVVEVRPNGGFYIEANIPAKPDGKGYADCAIGFFKIKDNGEEELVTEKETFCFDKKPQHTVPYYAITEPGNYVAKYYNKEHPEQPAYYSVKFTAVVKNGGAPNVNTKVKGNAKIVICKDVNEKTGKPIGTQSTLSAGACGNFLVDFGSFKEYYMLGWRVYKKEEDGEDYKFVDQIAQNVGGDGSGTIKGHTKPIKWALVEKLCWFEGPGEYTLFCGDWYKMQGDWHDYKSEDDYIGKLEFTVK